MTQEMYGANGRVGNKVYYTSNGKTVARAIVTPKNPQTTAQTVQRVIAAQVAKDYQKFKSICDHAFEGVSNGFNCMNRFKKLNMRNKRERAAEIQNAGESLAQFYNFQPIGSTKWVPGSVILSQGQLNEIHPTITEDTLGLAVGKIPAAANSYEGVCASLGAKRGDQLTFVAVVKNSFGNYEVKIARVILDPRTAEGGSAPMSTAFIVDNAINMPSRRNDGSFATLDFNDGVEFSMGNNGDVMCGVAVIASRKQGSNWLRSNATLVISEANIGSDLCGLWDAIGGSYSSGDLDVDSEYYLNNAGEGGSQGQTQEPATPGTSVTYNNNVLLNGVGQNISGGSASVTAPLNSVVISGTNLSEAPVTAQVEGSETVITPTKSATTITFNNLNIEAGHTLIVKRNGTTWFTVTAEQGGGDGPTGDAE